MKTIKISKELWQKLMTMKINNSDKWKSMDDLIKDLVQKYEEGNTGNAQSQEGTFTNNSTNPDE